MLLYDTAAVKMLQLSTWCYRKLSRHKDVSAQLCIISNMVKQYATPCRSDCVTRLTLVQNASTVSKYAKDQLQVTTAFAPW